MRFIILAPILCLLAIVAAYPIQHVRSLEEPAGGLTRREVAQEIYRRGGLIHKLGVAFHKLGVALHIKDEDPGFKVIWFYKGTATSKTRGAWKARQQAIQKMKALVDATSDGQSYVDLTTIMINLSYDGATRQWSADGSYTVLSPPKAPEKKTPSFGVLGT